MKSTSTILSLLLLTACANPPDAPSHATELRILSYNIRHGVGEDGQLDLTRAAALINHLAPDLVVLQEIDNGCRRSHGKDQMAELSRMTGLNSRFGAFMNYQGGEYGMGLMTPHAIQASTNHRLPDGSEPRTALAAHIQLPNGEPIVLCDVHLYQTDEQRLAQAQTIVDVFADVPAPVILAGDFNSRPDSPVMRLFGEHWVNPDKGEDRLTWSASDPTSEIDYILFRPAERFEVVSLDVLDEPVASDHRPVLMVLRMLP